MAQDMDGLRRATPISPESPDIIIVTGMSGAGRTETMHIFEDLGYFVIDNLPPSLILSVAEMSGINTGVGRHLAVVCDLRIQSFFGDLEGAIDELVAHEYSCAVVFLDASDEALRVRYALNRRPHPLAQEGEATIDAVRRERARLHNIRERADLVIDTSSLTPKELKGRLREAFSQLSDQQLMQVRVFSFGFKGSALVNGGDFGLEAGIAATIVLSIWIVCLLFVPNPFAKKQPAPAAEQQA